MLASNGRWSSSKRTKHIKARYFLVKDKIDQGELSIEYMPTDQMWSDVNTKPKQGRQFRVLRSELMNVPVDYDDEAERKITHPDLLPAVGEKVDAKVIKAMAGPVAAGAA